MRDTFRDTKNTIGDVEPQRIMTTTKKNRFNTDFDDMCGIRYVYERLNTTLPLLSHSTLHYSTTPQCTLVTFLLHSALH